MSEILAGVKCQAAKGKFFGTHNLSVSSGIFLGTDDSPRCEQSTVWPVQVHKRGQRGVNTSPPPMPVLPLPLPPFTLRLDPKYPVNGSPDVMGTAADISNSTVAINNILLWL
jgi:hypothetical protein